MNAKLPNGETRIAVAQRAIKGVAGFVPAQAQLSLRMYGAQSPASREKLPGHASRRAVRPGSASGGADHGRSRWRQGARLHADRLFAGASGERFPGRRQGARHRAGQRRQGNLPGRSGGGGEGARGQGHHRSHRRLHRRHRRARAAPGHRAATGGTYFDAPVGPELPDTLKSALNACKKHVVTLPPKPQPGKLRTTSATCLRPTRSSMRRPARRSRHFDRMRPGDRRCRPASTRSNSDPEAGRGSRCAPARPRRSSRGS